MSSGGRRLLAVGAAVVIVGAAVVVRSARDDSTVDNTHSSKLLCAAELGDACTALQQDDVDVVIEPAGTSIDRLSKLSDNESKKPGFDGWLAPAPAAEMVNDARTRAGLNPLFDKPGDPIGRSPLVIAMWPDRAAALTAQCGRAVDWNCLSSVAGAQWSSIGGQSTWGDVKISHDDPTATVGGLLVVDQVTNSIAAKATVTQSDLGDPALVLGLGRLEDAIRRPPGSQSPISQMLSTGPAVLDAVGTTEAAAAPAIKAAARTDKPSLIYGDPGAVADVVFAPVVGRPSGDLGDVVTGDAGRRALAKAGWRVDGQPRAPGVPSTPELPRQSNRPSSGVFATLQHLVADAWR